MLPTAQHISSTPLSPPRSIFFPFSTKCKHPPLMNICIYSLTLCWLYRPSVKAHPASDFAQRNRKHFTWRAREINLGQTHEDRVPTEVPSCSPTKHRSQHPYQGSGSTLPSSASWVWSESSCRFWDLFGEQAHWIAPLDATSYKSGIITMPHTQKNYKFPELMLMNQTVGAASTRPPQGTQMTAVGHDSAEHWESQVACSWAACSKSWSSTDSCAVFSCMEGKS